jgi:peptidoglycan/LPS O-acetylase OafA/YrhL
VAITSFPFENRNRTLVGADVFLKGTAVLAEWRNSKQVQVSVADRMKAAIDAPAGFDYLRIGLAISVLVFHSYASSYGDDIVLWRFPYRGVIALILPLFFALSGFLVVGSYMRSRNLLEFVLARVFRILPALVVDTLFSAVILGAAVTTISLAAYFESADFRAYFLNIVGKIHFNLPGVFETNPIQRVNQSIWTIPYELECYVILTVLAIIGVLRNRLLVLCIAVALTLALYTYNIPWKHLDIERVEPRFLILSFLFGGVLYLYRERIPANWQIAVASFIASYLMLSTTGLLYYLAAIPVAYNAVWLGTFNPKRLRVVSSGDYSYGIYLYAFPFQQLYSYLFPNHRDWMLNSLFALFLCAIFAFMSWHIVEKPFLKLRKGALMRWLTGEKPASPHLSVLVDKEPTDR